MLKILCICYHLADQMKLSLLSEWFLEDMKSRLVYNDKDVIPK